MQHFKVSLPTKITYGYDLNDMEGTTFTLTKREARALRNAYFLRSTLIYIAPALSALLITFAFVYALPKAPDFFTTALCAGLILFFTNRSSRAKIEKRIVSITSKAIETRES